MKRRESYLWGQYHRIQVGYSYNMCSFTKLARINFSMASDKSPFAVARNVNSQFGKFVE